MSAWCAGSTHVFQYKSWCRSAPWGEYGPEIPTGWPCKCRLTRLSRELTAEGIKVTAVPAQQWAGYPEAKP